jgi:VanZ family protein
MDGLYGSYRNIRKMVMKKIPRDKWKHFLVGIFMGGVLQAFAYWLLFDHHFLATLIAFVLVIAISYGFELFSLFTGKGHYDFLDAVAGTIGGVLGMVVVIIVQLS